MSKNNDNKLVPKLRFPEFHNNDTWQKKSLNEISSALLDGDWIESQDQSNYGVRLIQTGNIGVGEFLLKPHNARYISEETFERLNCTEIFPGDCLVSRLPDPIGRSCFIPDIRERMITAVDCLIIRFDKNQVVPYLFVLYSQTDKYFAEIKALASGSTRERISKENLSRIKIPITQITEQQKIAACLSSLDDVIKAETQKLELLKEHKKGLLQNLFPQEGETIPKLRFKEFEDSGEWEVKELGLLAENLDSKRIPITSNQREKGYIPYYGASGIIDYVKDYIYDENLLCISEDGANLIDRNYPIAFSISGKTWVNNHAHVLKFESISIQLLVEKYINSINIEGFLTGMAQPKLNRAKLDIIPIPLPKNPNEQQKIADALSSLDDLINAQSRKIEALKLHKKGLLQGLFPDINDGYDG